MHSYSLTSALWLIVKEKDDKKRQGNEVWDILFGGRFQKTNGIIYYELLGTLLHITMSR